MSGSRAKKVAQDNRRAARGGSRRRPARALRLSRIVKCPLSADSSRASRLDRARQYGDEGEDADQEHEDAGDHGRRLTDDPTLVDLLQADARDRLEGTAPHVVHQRTVLPDRDEQRDDAGADQHETEVTRRVRTCRLRDPFHLREALEELHDREAEADERHRGAQPGEQCAFGRKPGADPGEMAVGGGTHLEPGVGCGGSVHGWDPPGSRVSGCRTRHTTTRRKTRQSALGPTLSLQASAAWRCDDRQGTTAPKAYAREKTVP